MALTLSGMTLHTDNDTQQDWDDTDDLDDYNNAVQGTNSEAWQVSKNDTGTGTLTKSSALPTTRGLFIFWMASNLAPYYTDINLELESTNNNHKAFEVANSTNKAIGGNFVASAVDYVNKGTETGTFAPASFSALSITVDNSDSGNIRSTINNWIDAMYYGPGHTITGTTTTDKLFAEAAAIDELTANKYGVMWKYNDIIYSQGDITLNGTALVSKSETLVFVDTINGFDTYNFNGTGTVDFINTSVVAAGTIAVDLNTGSMTSFSMVGGAISGDGNNSIGSGSTLDGVVLTNRGTSSISNTPLSCTWNSCEAITMQTTGGLDSCVINKCVDSVAVYGNITNLGYITNCTFISDGTGAAINLGAIASDTTVSWDNTDTGYAATDGSTGNETIIVDVYGAITLTINVSDTATTPTIYNTGAGTVNVVAEQKTLTFTDLPDGVEARIRQGSFSIFYVASATGGTEAYSYSYVAGTLVQITVGGSGYVRQTVQRTLENANSSISFALEPDPSYLV